MIPRGCAVDLSLLISLKIDDRTFTTGAFHQHRGSKMKNTQALSTVVLLIWFVATNSPAHSANKTVKWISYGVEPCPKVVSTHAKMEVKGKKWTGPPEVWALIGWVSGFATAVNSAIGSPPNYFKTMTEIDMANWVASWCRDNPKHNLDKAMRVLATKYKP